MAFGVAGTIKHRKNSTVADGGDTTLIRSQTDWNDSEVLAGGTAGQIPARDPGRADGWSLVNVHPINRTNNTGAGLVAGDIVALGADPNVVIDNTSGSLKTFVAALDTIASAADGAFALAGVAIVKTQGAITSLNFVRKSATSLAVEDAGVALGDSAGPPDGTIGIALAAAAGPGTGTVTAFLFGLTLKKSAAGGLFGTGSNGAVTDGGGGTVIRNGIFNFTTYQIGGAVATTLTHDVGRALHIKAQTSFTTTANGTVNLNSKGGAGAPTQVAGGLGKNGRNGGPGIAGGGGGGAPLDTGVGGNGGGLGGGRGGDIAGAGNLNGQNGYAFPACGDTGFAANLCGPGAGGGSGGVESSNTPDPVGGAGGGFLVVETPVVILTAGYSFTATGAVGGGGNINSGGGGGGGGGGFVLRRKTLTGTFASTVTGGGGSAGGVSSGGAGGAGQSLDEVLP